MGEPDLSGYDDCEDTFREIDTDSAEHLQQTAYHAVATRRGTDLESEDLQGRWLDITQFLQGKGSIVGRIRGAVATAAKDLEEVDPRIQRAVYTVAEEAAGVVRWTAEITTKATTALVAAIASPFPQDEVVTPPPVLPDPGPVPPGMQTLAQRALSTAHVIGWLAGPNSGRILWTVGKTCDTAIEWLYEGIKQRFPDYAAEDALPWIGRDRRVIRGVAESTDSYRERLKDWLNAIRVWGTPWAVLMNIQAYFTGVDATLPVCRIVEHRPIGTKASTRAVWTTLAADGTLSHHVQEPSNWDWDSADPLRPTRLADRDPRFWVIIYQDSASGLFALDQSSPIQVYDFADATSYGDPDEGLDLARFAEDWKSAGSWCAGVIIAYDATLFDPTGSGAGYPDGTWHEYANPSTQDVNRAMPARYLEIKNSTATSVGA